MPDAYTFDQGNGNVRTFKNRKEMYDWMVDNNQAILEGDDAPAFGAHVARSTNPKAVSMASRLSAESTNPAAIDAVVLKVA